MAALLSLITCAATGWALAYLLPPPSRSRTLLITALTGPCGLGVFSLEYFVWRVFSSSRTTLFAIDGVVLAGLVLLAFKRTRHVPPALAPVGDDHPIIIRVLGSAFAAVFCIAAYCCARWMLADPQGGGWDAFEIWNLHARFLFLGGAHWQSGFTNTIPWSHPDYPLLLPSAIAHFWTYLNRDPEFIPAAIALVFTFSTVLLLFAAVRMLRGTSQAFLAGTILLATPFFLRQGVSQYADVPLCFFILASMVMLVANFMAPSTQWIALSGMMAAFAAWTKNEGLLFLCAFLLLPQIYTLKRGGWRSGIRELRWWLLGAVPILAVLAYFKLHIAPGGDLFASSNPMLTKVGDLSRYWLIVRWFGKELFLFSGWPLLTAMLIVYAKMLGWTETQHFRSALRMSAAVLALTLAGYFAAYVITPYDLKWHLRFSLDRLFLQLWPATLLLLFLSVRTPEEWLASRSAAQRRTAPLPIEPALDQAA